jgi:uncharacterized protein YjbI with pentapeptide repeats
MVMTVDATPPPPAIAVPAPSPLAATNPAVRLRELSPKAMWWTAALIAVLTAGAVVALWWPATAGLNGAELVTARLNALTIGLSIGVGSGGVIALYLAWRRQHSTEADLDNRERALAHQQHDAAERRLTELYLKAVEQLGSAQSAVRHGGLYALERVAQDNPSQRQTVVDVICAYLRRPYTPPLDVGESRRLGVRRPLLRSATLPRVPASTSGAGHIHEDRQQEREVRLTAQRLLHRHLQPGDDPNRPFHTFWPHINLDLTGATLIDFTLTRSRVNEAIFRGATFVGIADFDEAAFTGAANFGASTFIGTAQFRKATFTGPANFGEATFTGDAEFRKATFTGPAGFEKATFASYASFGDATFGNTAWFCAATFTGTASFVRATFTGTAAFIVATFTGHAGFDRATFYDDVRLGATFTRTAGFIAATFTGDAEFVAATFTCHARFDLATFTGAVSFDRANFDDAASFLGTTRNGIAFNPAEREQRSLTP